MNATTKKTAKGLLRAPAAEAYPGVYVRGGKVYITLQVRPGLRCREATGYDATPTGLANAHALKVRLDREIKIGTFDFAKEFPRSLTRCARTFGVSPRPTLTLAELCGAWLEQIAPEGREPSTLRDYGQRIGRHILPTFGALLIDQVIGAEIRDHLLKAPISNPSRNNTLIPLRQAYDWACEHKWIAHNPIRNIKPFRRERKKPNAFTVGEMEQVLGALEPAFEAVYAFAFATGLRIPEYRGLKFTDIDWANATIQVQRQLVKQAEKKVKTLSSERRVDLDERALGVLRRCAEEARPGQEYIFCDPATGRPWSRDRLYLAWRRAFRRLTLPYRPPKTTRHTYCSHRLSAGDSPYWVRWQAGHSSFRMIDTVYGEFIPDAWRRGRNR